MIYFWKALLGPLAFLAVVLFCFGIAYDVRADILTVAGGATVLVIGAGLLLYRRFKVWYDGYQTRRMVLRVTDPYRTSHLYLRNLRMRRWER